MFGYQRIKGKFYLVLQPRMIRIGIIYNEDVAMKICQYLNLIWTERDLQRLKRDAISNLIIMCGDIE